MFFFRINILTIRKIVLKAKQHNKLSVKFKQQSINHCNMCSFYIKISANQKFMASIVLHSIIFSFTLFISKKRIKTFIQKLIHLSEILQFHVPQKTLFIDFVLVVAHGGEMHL